MSDAVERLELSRARLRAAMLPPPALTSERPARSGSWFERIAELPTVRAVVESLESWWNHHPLRPVSHVAGEASQAIVKPFAARHPWTLVLTAAGVGATLAWARPWRWVFRSAVFAGLVPQLASRVASSLPIESWMAMAGSMLATPRAPSRGAEPLAGAAL
jgi:hypothetical protein